LQAEARQDNEAGYRKVTVRKGRKQASNPIWRRADFSGQGARVGHAGDVTKENVQGQQSAQTL
jgi:hypothetical protein